MRRNLNLTISRTQRRSVEFAPSIAMRWICILALTLACASSKGAADTNFVSLGTVEAHATHIIAKFKPGASIQGRGEALQRSSLGIRRQHYLLPGLVTLEETNSLGKAAAPAANSEARRNHLLQRIQGLKDSGLFEYVEPDYVVHATA